MHGQSAIAYGTSNRNYQASPQKGANVESGAHDKDRKYQNLQSSAFGESERPAYNKEGVGAASFASNADWKTQGGMAKPKNRGSTHVDTYNKKQQQLSS